MGLKHIVALVVITACVYTSPQAASEEKRWIYIGKSSIAPEEFIDQNSIRKASDIYESVPPEIVYAETLVNYVNLSKVKKKYRIGKPLSEVYSNLFNCKKKLAAIVGVDEYEELRANGRLMSRSIDNQAIFVPAFPMFKNSYSYACKWLKGAIDSGTLVVAMKESESFSS